MSPNRAATRERIQDAIRRDIIHGTLLPGKRLTEVSLASSYGVSRVPVREALHALEAEGFVESRPYSGSRVSEIPRDEAEDLFEIREALERAIVRRAACRAAHQLATGQPSDHWWTERGELAGILDAGDRALAEGAVGQLVELNMLFHLGVAAMGGSRSLTALLRQISGKIEWLYAADVDHRGRTSWVEHRTILAAIDSGNAVEAERLMGAHVNLSREGYLRRHSDQA